MKTLMRIFAGLIFILFIDSCIREDELNLRTLEVTEISDTCVIFNCELIYNMSITIDEFGFIWSESDNFDNSHLETSTFEMINGCNSLAIDEAFILGKKYYVKAYAKVNGSIIYGNVISFEGLAIPELLINGFLPEKGTWNDTIVLLGKNFNNEINTFLSVTIDNKPLTIISRNDTLIKTIIPIDLGNKESYFTVYLKYDTVHSVKPFKLLPPQISDFSPKKGERGTEIIITGNYFHPQIANNKVKIGEYYIDLMSADKNNLTAIIPLSMTVGGEYNLTVLSGLQSTTAEVKYIHYEHWIKIGEGVTSVYRGTGLDEKYFMIGQKYYYGYFNLFERRLGTCSNSLTEIIPESYTSTNLVWYLNISTPTTVFVDHNNIYIVRSSRISEVDQLNHVLIDRKPFPDPSVSLLGITMNNTGFLYTSGKQLWQYQSSNDSWINVEDMPEGELIKVMEIENINYILFKLKDSSFDFYKYDLFNNFWEKVNHYQADDSYMKEIAYSSWFGYNSFGYCLSSGYSNGIYQTFIFIYDPKTNTWQRKLGPFNVSGTGVIQYGYGKFIYSKFRNWTSPESIAIQSWKYDTSK